MGDLGNAMGLSTHVQDVSFQVLYPFTVFMLFPSSSVKFKNVYQTVFTLGRFGNVVLFNES